MKKATRIKLFDGKGNELHDYKGIVNEENETQIFSIVKNGYRIIQHEDVSNTVKELIEDKNLNAVVNTFEMNQGGRLHIAVTFPEIKLDIEENGMQSKLYCTYDNSYDGTTGLRLSVGAKLGNAILWIPGSKYYSKHTKKVSVSDFEKNLDKGIHSFQNEIKKQFMDMYKTQVTQAQALDFLEKVVAVKEVSKKYVEPIVYKVKQATIKNKWQLYCIVCEVITHETQNVSIDARDRQLKAIITNMHKTIRQQPVEVLCNLSEEIKQQSEEKSKVVDLHTSNNLPEDLIGLTVPTELSIKKLSRKEFKVMRGDTEIETFRKYKQAKRFIKTA